jgi:hypothetical protein
MKKNILRLLTAVGSAAGAISALDLGGFINLFPPETGAIILAVAGATLAVKEVVVVVGDHLDDGVRNDSFLGK